MLAGFLTLAIVVLRLFPETPAARALHFWLVALPLEKLRRLERRHLIFVALALVAAQALALAGSMDLAVVALWDVSTLIDVMIAAATIAAIARGKAAWLHAGATLSRLMPARRRGTRRGPRSRARRRTALRLPANDEDGPARELAA